MEQGLVHKEKLFQSFACGLRRGGKTGRVARKGGLLTQKSPSKPNENHYTTSVEEFLGTRSEYREGGVLTKSEMTNIEVTVTESAENEVCDVVGQLLA